MKVPGFLLNAMYQKGTLRRDNGGLSMTFKNNLTLDHVVLGEWAEVNGTRYDASEVTVASPGQRMRASDITEGEPFDFITDGPIELHVHGAQPEPGTTRVTIALTTRLLGSVQVKVKDRLP